MTTTEPTRFDLLRLLGLDPAATAAGLARDYLDNGPTFNAARHLANRLNDLGLSTTDAEGIEYAIRHDPTTGQLATNLARVLKANDHAPEATPCFDPFPY